MQLPTVTVLTLLACSLATPAFAQEGAPVTEARADAGLEPITSGQYVASGLVGTLVGYGIGHAMIGEYGNVGWIFTLGEAVSVLAVITGIALVANSALGIGVNHGWTEADKDRARIAGGSLYYVGLAANLGFHIWEVVDIWSRPVGRITKSEHASTKSPTVGILPVAFERGGWGLAAGLTF